MTLDKVNFGNILIPHPSLQPPTPEPVNPDKPVNPDQPSGGNAKTGDESNLALWISLMAGALLLAGGAAVVIRRKKKAEK